MVIMAFCEITEGKREGFEGYPCLFKELTKYRFLKVYFALVGII